MRIILNTRILYSLYKKKDKFTTDEGTHIRGHFHQVKKNMFKGILYKATKYNTSYQVREPRLIEL